MEIWKSVAEGYEVSTVGRVKSFKLDPSGRLLTPHADRGGYLHVGLSIGGKSKRFYVHRLVAQAFIPNPLGKREVNHINGIKTDNRVENLEWVTPSENTLHAFQTGLAKTLRGAENGAAKLSAEQAAEIRRLCIIGDKTFGMRELAKKFNVSEHTVFRIVHFETYKETT